MPPDRDPHAKAYEQVTLAEANRAARVAAAQAQAADVRLAGAAKANATQLNGAALASAIREKGLAEAAGIEARAKALSTNQDAVIAQQFAENYPAIVAAAASSLGNIDNLVVLNGAEGMEDMLAKAMTMGGAGLGLAQKLMTSIKTDKPSHDSTYAGVPVGAVEGGPHIPCPPTARSTQRRYDFQHPMPLSFLTKAACHTSVSFRQPNPAKPECVERRHAAMSAIRDRFCMVSGAQELGIAVSRFFSGAGSAETAHGALQRRGTGNDTRPV